MHPIDNLKINMIPHTGQAIVSYRGKEYKLMVYLGHGNTWQDISTTKDWSSIATQIKECLDQIDPSPEAFESASFVLKGDFTDITTTATPTLKERNITVESAEVTKKGADSKLQTTKIDPLTIQPKVKKILEDLGKNLVQVKPLQSSNAHKKDSASKEQYETVTIDPLAEVIGKNRPKNRVDGKTTLDYALAHQLQKMDPSFATSSMDAIVKGIRAKVATHVKKIKTTDPLFNQILISLQNANQKDHAKLVKALGGFLKIMDEGELSQTLLPSTNLNDDQKNKLIKLYANYIEDPITAVCDKTFIQLLVAASAKDKTHYGIILIEEDEKGVQKRTVYPETASSIALTQSALIHAQEVKQADGTSSIEYFSYDRAPAGFKDLSKEHTGISTKVTTENRKKEPPKFPGRIEKHKGGRCCDYSLAYVIMKKLNPGLELTDDALKTTATELRKQVAHVLLRSELIINNEEFIRALITSIQEIPDHSTPSPVPSKACLGATTIGTDNYLENRKQLCEFYANYITHAEMLNELDSAFLYLIQFTNNYKMHKIAVIEDSKICAKYPVDQNLSDDWIFVEHVPGHYYAINKEDPAAQVQLNAFVLAEQNIREKHRKLEEQNRLTFALNTFISDLYSSTKSDEEWYQSLVALETQYLQAFEALKCLVWIHAGAPLDQGFDFGGDQIRKLKDTPNRLRDIFKSYGDADQLRQKINERIPTST